MATALGRQPAGSAPSHPSNRRAYLSSSISSTRLLSPRKVLCFLHTSMGRLLWSVITSCDTTSPYGYIMLYNVLLVVWEIWRSRCRMRYEGVQSSYKQVHDNIRYKIELGLRNIIFKKEPSDQEAILLVELGYTYRVKKKTFKLVRWIPPSAGYVLNTDGACKGWPGVCGGGGCIRDSDGNLILAYSYYYGLGDSFIAETRALCDGLRLAEACGINIDCVGMDSAVLVSSVLGDDAPSWKCIRWWRSAKDYIAMHGTNVKHIYREANGVADALASNACVTMCHSVFFSFLELPTTCKGPFTIDRSGLWGIRIG